MMKFKGIFPALVTPLREDESINTEALDSLINYLIDRGANGFYVGGATGEGLALRTEERMVLTEASVKAAAGRAPVIVQIASTDFSDAVALAKHAERVGADGISATPPLFFGYDADDVYNYYKRLAGAVHIPFMMYYNPAAGFNMNAEFAAKVFEIDNVTSIKWTNPRYDEVIVLKDLTHGEINVINGPDEMLLMGLAAGADGGIGTTYNFMLDKFLGIYDCFHRGDIPTAMKIQIDIDRVIAAVKRYSLIPATKAIVEAMGFDVGAATFPMKRYSETEKQSMLADFRAAGLDI